MSAKYIGAIKDKNSIGLVTTTEGIKVVPYIKCELGEHLYEENGKYFIGGKPEKSEKELLQERCKELGIKINPNTSIEKMKKIIDQILTTNTTNDSNTTNTTNDSNTTNTTNDSNDSNTSPINEGAKE